MLTKITKALIATAMLATAIASPALAQQVPNKGDQGGMYRGYPITDWTRPDSW